MGNLLMIEQTYERYLRFLADSYSKGVDTIQQLESGLEAIDMENLYAISYNFYIYGKYGAAKEGFKKLTVLNPNYDVYWRALGAVCQQMKNYPEAIAAFERAIENNPKDVVSYIYLGECLLLARMKQQGIKILEKAFELLFLAQNPWRKKVLLLLSKNKLATAEEGGRENKS